MSPSASARTYTLRHAKREDIPAWLKRHADLWIQDPCVEAVVLFGSRTTGKANTHSDWDVAILHGQEKPCDLVCERDLREHEVDLPIISMETYLNQAHSVGSLSHEVAAHGRILAGSVPSTLSRRLEINEGELSRHLEYSFRFLSFAITDCENVLSFSDLATTPLDRIPGGAAVAPSVDGAKRVAKALCLYLGLPLSRTHNVEELAAGVPSEWRAKVMDMDGNTHRAHLATYLENQESLADVQKRITSSLRLFAEFIEPCAKRLSDPMLASLDQRIEAQVNVLAVEGYRKDQDTHAVVRTLSESFWTVLEILHREHLKRSKS